MESPFDIFRAEDGGSLLWRGSAASMDEAKARILELAKSWPAEYVVINLQSGLRVSISADGKNYHGSEASSSEGHSQTKSAPDC